MTRLDIHSETCGCGTRYQLKHKARHLEKSATHKRWLQNRVANSNIVQNNTNNHVGQQTYYNNTSHDNASYGYNNSAEHPTYYNNVSYDYNDPYDFVFYGNEDEYDEPDFDFVYDDSDPDDQYDLPDNVY